MIDSFENTVIKITLTKSLIGTKLAHKRIIKGLGLRKLNKYKILKDTPEIRGMIRKVNYLIKCE
ncbi:MAG: 50S ribosomal protein L30 [Nitrosomonas sp.]|nr:MAG: 50S ribosomal protein L30 [Nitrosomonas sp.]